ncbi:MAG: zinc-binding dehydrogenase [Bifidobacterium sp.]|uniref:zinc-binding dehydrogenase n=2 Tax=Bifidobacterium sp. TaxID=41200 RepID=UPI0039EB8520
MSSQSMNAVVVRGAGDLQIEKRPIPIPHTGEVLIRVKYAGICGSDLHYYHEGSVGAFAIREPLVVGHEIVGTVERDTRSGADALPHNTPVAIHPATPGMALPGLEDRPSIWPGSRYLGSAATQPHTQGGMSEFIVARSDQIRALPAGLPLRRAVLAEPLGVALHALHRGGGVRGKRVLVSGAGPVGLLAAGAAVALGASQVASSDVIPEPLARAAALGVTDTYLIDRNGGNPPKQSFDLVIECSGSPSAVSTAIASAVPGGVVVQVGMLPAGLISADLSQLISREIDVRGAFRFNDEITEAVTLLASDDDLGQIVTDVFGLDEVVAAFDRAADAKASGKVVIDLSEPSTPTIDKR